MIGRNPWDYRSDVITINPFPRNQKTLSISNPEEGHEAEKRSGYFGNGGEPDAGRKHVFAFPGYRPGTGLSGFGKTLAQASKQASKPKGSLFR